MKEIKAREGYYLTQSAEVGNERIFITAIKGVNVKDSDWREATEEEKVGYEEEQAKLLEEDDKKLTEQKEGNN